MCHSVSGPLTQYTAISLQPPPDPFFACILGLSAGTHLYCAVQAAIGPFDIPHLKNLNGSHNVKDIVAAPVESRT